ncbi:MAG: hypothetical protein E6342_18300 [Clostridium sp.]|uniref:hypothetical protein n=1 Tax=Clostridium sp. TaxID=1506 RepID=UPI002914F2B7|nr:hypothetical protein [Clostridium sp.]MDU4844003.1 hypothetical protein [Leclercia adecarboxylata]MDU7089637.1 hypothetical protein [Clostridium sp.]
MKKINEKRFLTESESKYRNTVLQILNSLCEKGIDFGLNEEEETLRKEINRVTDKYYLGR